MKVKFENIFVSKSTSDLVTDLKLRKVACSNHVGVTNVEFSMFKQTTTY
jgi:hypothetical protein